MMILNRALSKYKKDGGKKLIIAAGKFFCRKGIPDIFKPRYGYLNTITSKKIFFTHFKEKFVRPLNEWILCYRGMDEEGTNVMEMDWDNLIILDACRYDIFKQISDIDGTTSKKKSIAPKTPLFLKRTFSGKQYFDTVYITANPHIQKYAGGNTFHKVYNIWKTDWSHEYQTVLPKSVTETSKEAVSNHPKKRLIIHYMQPHEPFIGKSGHKFMMRENLRGFGPKAKKSNSNNLKLYSAVRYGLLNCDDSELQQYYIENLKEVLDSVSELVDDLEGKTVITADHGELIGDKVGPIPVKEYGHPKLHVDELLAVPWCELKYRNRRKTEPEPPTEKDGNRDDELIKERLEHLGYY